jgi:hypothetical protein
VAIPIFIISVQGYCLGCSAVDTQDGSPLEFMIGYFVVGMMILVVELCGYSRIFLS